MAIGIEAHGDFVCPWRKLSEVQPRAINSPLFFAVDVKMSVANTGLMSLVNVFWGKAKMGGLNL